MDLLLALMKKSEVTPSDALELCHEMKETIYSKAFAFRLVPKLSKSIYFTLFIFKYHYEKHTRETFLPL